MQWTEVSDAANLSQDILQQHVIFALNVNSAEAEKTSLIQT